MLDRIKNSRQEARKSIQQICNITRSGSLNRTGQQINKYIESTRKNLAGNSFHSDLNVIDETNRQTSIVVSTRQRDNLITMLKTEAQSLEIQNKYLKKEIERFNNNTSLSHVNDQYATPYVRISQEIELFATRLYIRPEEYDKVEYFNMWLVLFDSSLKIYSSNNEEELAKRTLFLKDIKSARYLDDTMLIEFQPLVDNIEYLFIKFKNQEHMKKWDFALYINKIIETCLHKQKLFLQEMSHQLSVITKRPAAASTSSNLYSRRKVSYNQNLLSRSLESDNPEMTRSNKAQSVRNVMVEGQPVKDGKDSREVSDKNSTISKKYEKQKQKTDDLYKEIAEKRKQFQSSKEKDVDQIKWGEDEDSTYNTPNTRADYNTSFGIVETASAEFRIKPMEAEKTKSRTPTNENPLETSTITTKAQMIRKTIANLKKPKCFVKCSKGGISGHTKEVYLSQNQAQLCWKDLKSNRVRKISIEDIMDVQLHEKGEGLNKHAQNISPENCLVIKTSKKQILQLYCENKNDIEQFHEDLQTLVNHLENNYQE